ncbi:AMC2 [Symbiodinium natans]|uniref:AMC2 protein n=1 Tax=Symbiodinium natans TaxID=878477 RepID=A0A812UBJ7_9DINO|nr:AMC2 [Symbiodinium natans]
MGNSQSHTNPATAGVLRLKRNILKFSSEHTVDSVREKAGLLDTEHEVKGATFNEFKLTFDTMAFLSVAVLSCQIQQQSGHKVQQVFESDGADSPLSCIVDGERVCELAAKSGIKDIVKMYDDGSTEHFPCIEELKAQVAAMAERCKPGHFFVLAYSGHGTNQENEEEQDGLDSIICLRTRDGEDDHMVDDDLAQLISEAFDPSVTVLVLADACNSAGVLDCDTPGIWGKRHVAAISGCQNEQCSTDTGDGGAMTNALLHVLGHKKISKMRKQGGVSVQYIFNRMVEAMPEDEEEEEEEGEDDEYYDEDDCEDEDYEYEDEEEDVDPISGEVPEPGQNINLSWPGGCDPTKIAFPF